MSIEPLGPQVLQQLCSADIDPAALLEALADLELSAQVDAQQPQLLAAYYCAYLLALFFHDDLNEARFLVKRIPNSLQSDAAVTNAVFLLKALYSRSYPAIYSHLTAPVWPDSLSTLRERFTEAFRTRTCFFLSGAYTCISPESVSFYLGIDASSAIPTQAWFIQGGWKIDDIGMLVPPPLPESDRLPSKKGDDIRISRLTTLVTHLTEG